MAVTETTVSRSYQKPHRSNGLDVDVERLRTSLDQIDTDVSNILTVLAEKAALVHNHTIGEVAGLQDQLDGKQPAGATFSLNSLSDVDVSQAANNQFLRKTQTGWISVDLTATMIVSGTLSQDRLPSHLTAESLEAKYAKPNEAVALSLILRR